MADPTPTTVLLAGRYALADEIGAGGMATVHLAVARGQGGFSRVVAVKRLLPCFAADPEFTAMLIDEACLAAHVHHPNVIPTLDVAASEGELFIVLEYVHGESLARLLREEVDPDLVGVESYVAAPPPVAVAIALDVLRGLEAAHAAKADDGRSLALVHRDVTPHNILVGADGVARVFDFGIAKAAGRSQATREGEVKGKLAYMAPEQLAGGSDRRTDVYAVGVCLWEALTGRRLFADENESIVLAKVKAGLVDPPRRHVPDLPEAVEEVVLRALSRDPGARFDSARDMERALAAALAPASNVQVAAWVESRARAGLAARAALFARAEALASALPEDAMLLPTPEPPAPVASTSPRDGRGRSGAPPPRVAPPPAVEAGPWYLRPRALLVALAALGLVLVSLVVLAAREPGSRDVAAPGAAASVASAAPLGSVASPSLPPEVVEVPTEPATPVGSAPRASGAAAPSPRRARTAPRTASPRDRCDPPYSVDTNGERHYRKECLR